MSLTKIVFLVDFEVRLVTRAKFPQVFYARYLENMLSANGLHWDVNTLLHSHSSYYVPSTNNNKWRTQCVLSVQTVLSGSCNTITLIMIFLGVEKDNVSHLPIQIWSIQQISKIYECSYFRRDNTTDGEITFCNNFAPISWLLCVKIKTLLSYIWY
jgi:hypothetical protein